MNNSLKSYKKIELCGEERLLKFDYNSVSDLEEMYDKGIAGILKEEQIGFRLVRAFYWAGLKWKIQGLTLDKVGYWLGKEIQDNEKNVMELMGPVMDALKQSRLLGSNKESQAIEGEYEEITEGENENPNE